MGRAEEPRKQQELTTEAWAESAGMRVGVGGAGRTVLGIQNPTV